MKIKAGQLVVVVGSNGSGKSTLVRILSRLYDPSSGTVLIDGRPSREYRVKDLQQATAIMSQDNQMYPLSLAENIGLGLPEHSKDLDMIKEAAKLGGAEEFIGKLKNGFETTLEPYSDAFHLNLHGDKTHPLAVQMEELQKSIDISGGEKQRVIACVSFSILCDIG